MSYIFGKLWHLAIIWAIRKAFQCILQCIRFLLANQTRLSPTSDNDSYSSDVSYTWFVSTKHGSNLSVCWWGKIYGNNQLRALTTSPPNNHVERLRVGRVLWNTEKSLKYSVVSDSRSNRHWCDLWCRMLNISNDGGGTFAKIRIITFCQKESNINNTIYIFADKRIKSLWLESTFTFFLRIRQCENLHQQSPVPCQPLCRHVLT